MAVIALVLFVVGTGLVLGLRTLVHWRHTGDTGHRHDAGPRGSAAWWGKQLFALSNLLVGAGPVAALFGLPPLPGLDHKALGIAGLVIAVAGIAIAVAAQLNMGDSWRIGVDREERTDLVVTGFFAFARNPIFTGFVVISLGLALVVPNPVTIGGLIVVIVAVEIQVRRVEEPYLVAMHGADFVEYATRVGRFIPGVGRSVAITR